MKEKEPKEIDTFWPALLIAAAILMASDSIGKAITQVACGG